MARVLIVEDETSIADTLMFALQAQALQSMTQFQIDEGRLQISYRQQLLNLTCHKSQLLNI